MKRTALTILGAAGLVTAALSGPANAALITPNGSLSVSDTPGTVVTLTPGPNILANTTAVNFTNPNTANLFEVTTVNGNLSPTVSPADIVTKVALPLMVPDHIGLPTSAVDITVTVDGLVWHLTVGALISLDPQDANNSGDLALGYFGTFHDSNATPTFADSTGSMSETCTQAAGLPTTAISCSETLAVPGVPIRTNVPEPASMALLGSALVGFGVFRRRRKTS